MSQLSFDVIKRVWSKSGLVTLFKKYSSYLCWFSVTPKNDAKTQLALYFEIALGKVQLRQPQLPGDVQQRENQRLTFEQLTEVHKVVN